MKSIIAAVSRKELIQFLKDESKTEFVCSVFGRQSAVKAKQTELLLETPDDSGFGLDDYVRLWTFLPSDLDTVLGSSSAGVSLSVFRTRAQARTQREKLVAVSLGRLDVYPLYKGVIPVWVKKPQLLSEENMLAPKTRTAFEFLVTYDKASGKLDIDVHDVAQGTSTTVGVVKPKKNGTCLVRQYFPNGSVLTSRFSVDTFAAMHRVIETYVVRTWGYYPPDTRPEHVIILKSR